MHKIIEKLNWLNQMRVNKIIQNGLWLYVLQFFNTVLPLISLPYITRILGIEKYGVFAFSLNIVGYFTVVVEYGFDFSGTRKIALSSKKEEVKDIFFSIISARALLFIICTIMLILINNFNNSTIQKISCYILFLSVLGTVMQQTWLFQGLQKMYLITIISVLSRILSLIMTFIFVKEPNDILIYCLLYAITPISIGIIGLIVSVRMLKSVHVKVKVAHVFAELKTGWYVFITSLSSKVFSAIGITILGLVSTDEQVGVFSALQKIPMILLLLWTPISQVMYPVSSSQMEKSKQDGYVFVIRFAKFVLPIFIGIVVLICCFSKPLVTILFGLSYQPYFFIVIPLLFWMLFGIANNFLGIQILLAGGYDKEYSKCFQISVIITVVLNCILIKKYTIIGASLAPLLSEMVLFIMLKFTVNRTLKKGFIKS